MKNISKIIISNVLTFIVVVCSAQSITIKSVSFQPKDNSAIEQPVIDNNGDTCALLKIKTDHLIGVEFTNKNQYAKADYIDGTYWVYVPSIGHKLDFSHPNYLPIQLDMAEYGYKRLKGGKTYLVVIESPLINELKSKVILNVEPTNATVSFNDRVLVKKPGGTYSLTVAPGNYSYYVEYDNYSPKQGVVTIGKSDSQTVTVMLQPIMHKVKVVGNVKNARVIVDNVDYGKAGSMMLPQGVHNIRFEADGYNDQTKNVEINSTTHQIDFNLDKNALTEHVYPTNVTIYTRGSKVYINNKESKEWETSMKTVQLMPGKYVISDDLNNKKKIEVKTSPMEVYLSENVSNHSDEYEYSESSKSNNSSMTNSSNTTYPGYNTQRRTTTGSSSNYTNSYNTRRQASESMQRSRNNNSQQRTTEYRRSTNGYGGSRSYNSPSRPNRR